MLGILTGGAVGFVTFLILSLLVLCLLHKNKGKAIIGETGEQGGWEELLYFDDTVNEVL